MFICGYNFCGGELACAMTPTGIENINYIELKNGIYDDLYASKDLNFEISSNIPKEWTFYTVLYAPFNNNTNAGNVDWNVETVSHLILKSRKQNSFQWKTIFTKPIQTIDDFSINYNDYLVGSNTPMEYAIVPVLYGTEGNYAISKITPMFNGIFLIEGDRVYSTRLSDGKCDTTRNIPSSTIELLNSRYPVYIRNSIANYDTGTCSGWFIPFDEESCQYKISHIYDSERTSYQKEVMDFITDGIPKILKLSDGRMWIVQVTPSPTDTADQIYNNRLVSFQWVEVGDANSEEDLYYLGLSDVSEEWWNK